MTVQHLKFRKKLFLSPLVFFFKLWNKTLRFDIDQTLVSEVQAEKNPIIIAFWHNQLFPIVHLEQHYLSNQKVAGLVSPSKDGAWLARLLEMCGIHPVRGSSGARGGVALGELLDAMKEGYSVAITPDGPRGPLYRLKPGVIWLADQSAAPILTLKLTMQSYWALKSWDRFQIPKPFSKIVITGKLWRNIDELKATHQTLLGEKALEQALM